MLSKEITNKKSNIPFTYLYNSLTLLNLSEEKITEINNAAINKISGYFMVRIFLFIKEKSLWTKKRTRNPRNIEE